MKYTHGNYCLLIVKELNHKIMIMKNNYITKMLDNNKSIVLNWSFWQNFFKVFIPIALVIIITSVVLFEIRNSIEFDLIKNREKNTIQLLENTFNNEFDVIISDLLNITESEQLAHLLLYDDNKHINLVKREFLRLCKWKRNYDQIRLIDLNGKERIRINMANDNCIVVKDEKLQNKSDRYYFKKTIKLNKGEIYISPFDLNIENQAIEQPLKPMIRYASPVFDLNGEKQGIIVINYLGNKVLSRIKEISEYSTGDISLLNKFAYYLISPKSEEEWGFMFPDGVNKKFSYHYPESWKIISKNKNGQFNNEGGIITFQKLELINHPVFGLRIINDENQLTFVSRISPEFIRENSFSMFMDFIIFNVYILLLMLIVSFVLARARMRKKIHEESLKEKERLQGVLEMAGAVSHEINQPLQIISTYTDLLVHMDAEEQKKTLQKITEQIKKIGIISRKLSKITTYKTRDYVKGIKIIDLDRSSEWTNNEGAGDSI